MVTRIMRVSSDRSPACPALTGAFKATSWDLFSLAFVCAANLNAPRFFCLTNNRDDRGVHCGAVPSTDTQHFVQLSISCRKATPLEHDTVSIGRKKPAAPSFRKLHRVLHSEDDGSAATPVHIRRKTRRHVPQVCNTDEHSSSSVWLPRVIQTVH